MWPKQLLIFLFVLVLMFSAMTGIYLDTRIASCRNPSMVSGVVADVIMISENYVSVEFEDGRVFRFRCSGVDFLVAIQYMSF